MSERQVVKARDLIAATINQTLGDQHNWSFESSRVAAKPIYLTYADSDVQQLYLLNGARSAAEYGTALDRCLRLLLLFKPPGCPILVSPSSVIQSPITRDTYRDFAQFAEGPGAHLLLLRREPSWAEYFHKRQLNTSGLRNLERYSGYFKDSVASELDRYASTRKKVFSGRGSARLWIDGIRLLRPDLPSEELRRLEESISQLLDHGVFVWETALVLLDKQGMSGFTKNDVLASLVDSYVETVGQGCYLPRAIGLDWDPCPSPQDRVYADLGLLAALIGRLGWGGRIYESTLDRFGDLIVDERISRLRMVLEASNSVDAVALVLRSDTSFLKPL